MEYFPFYMNIEGADCLVIGGGRIAQNKIEKISSFKPRITVAAPKICPEIRAFSGLTLVEAEFTPDLLSGRDFVIAATDSRDVNHQIAQLCKAGKIPVNAVDSREDCSFIFPALIHKGPLSIGISTAGSSPSAAIWLKERISALIPDQMEDILLGLEAIRPQIQKAVPEQKRSAVYRELLSQSIALGRAPDEAELRQILQSEAYTND